MSCLRGPSNLTSLNSHVLTSIELRVLIYAREIYAYLNLRFLYRENQYSNFMNVIIGLISIPNYDANLGNVKKLSCIKNYRFPINETPKVPHYKIFRILFFV